MSTHKGIVYLIHFRTPLFHASHYIGWTGKESITARLRRHRNGRGARILKACMAKGIKFKVIRIWKNVDRDFERSLKNKKSSKQFCPVCGGKK